MSAIPYPTTKTKARFITYTNDTRTSGTIKYPDGRLYKGEIEDGLCNGFGLLYYQNRLIYQGQWKYNQMNGHGNFLFLDGDRYIGSVQDGYAHGKGKFFFDGYSLDVNFDRYGPVPLKLE